MELCTPIHAIQNPAKAGPKTMASCQVELLQVAALGYTFFGTIKATNEKMVGPINALINPPEKPKYKYQLIFASFHNCHKHKGW